jgi:hypothetical protein
MRDNESGPPAFPNRLPAVEVLAADEPDTAMPLGREPPLADRFVDGDPRHTFDLGCLRAGDVISSLLTHPTAIVGGPRSERKFS